MKLESPLHSRSATARVIIVVLVAALLLAGGGFAYRWFGLSQVLRQRADLRGDLGLLLEGSTESSHPSAVGLALYRLNQNRVPEGRAQALARVQHPDPIIRSSVAKSLAQLKLEGPVLVAAQQLALDADVSVRLALWEGFQSSFDEIKKNWALTFYRQNEKVIDEQEKLALFLLFFRIDRSPQWVDFTLQIIRSLLGSEQKSAPAELATLSRGFENLSKMNPRPQRKGAEFTAAQFLATAFLSNQVPPPARPEVLRYLANHDVGSLREWYPKHYFKADLALQLMALQFLPQVCPDNRHDVIAHAEGLPPEFKSHQGLAQHAKQKFRSNRDRQLPECALSAASKPL